MTAQEFVAAVQSRFGDVGLTAVLSNDPVANSFTVQFFPKVATPIPGKKPSQLTREVAQAKRFLAARHGLTAKNAGDDLAIQLTGKVPDGDHSIPLGTPPVVTAVKVRGNKMYIGNVVFTV
jgi:hypothetical protein